MVPVETSSNWSPSIFSDFFENEWLAKTGVTVFVISVIENDKDHKVEMAAPGMIKDDFKVNADKNNNLTVRIEKKGEKKEEKKDKKYLRREFSYSKFQQTTLLPENVEKDKIPAKVEHGILSTEIPKMKEEEEQKIFKAIGVEQFQIWSVVRSNRLSLLGKAVRPLTNTSGTGNRHNR